MSWHNHKNATWTVGDNPTWEGAQAAILMDIRAELQTLNRLFSCRNFIDFPRKLDQIVLNTKPKRRKKKKAVTK